MVPVMAEPPCLCPVGPPGVHGGPARLSGALRGGISRPALSSCGRLRWQGSGEAEPCSGSPGLCRHKMAGPGGLLVYPLMAEGGCAEALWWPRPREGGAWCRRLAEAGVPLRHREFPTEPPS